MPSGPYGCVAVLAVILAGPARELRPNDFFTRGDVDQSGRLDVTDAVTVLLGLFAGDGASFRCEAAADANDDDIVSVADAIYVLRALFQAGPAPPAPFPDCGFDATGKSLGCEIYEACRFRFTFVGIPYAADGVYFVVDRSLNMQGSGELSAVKFEMARIVNEMPDGTESAFIFFDSGILRFPLTPDPWVASEAMKLPVKTFIQEIAFGDESTCAPQAFFSAFDSMARGNARRKLIFFVQSSRGTCKGADEAEYLHAALEEITRANGRRARIHTFSVHPIDSRRREFLTKLAEANGGAYTALWEARD